MVSTSFLDTVDGLKSRLVDFCVNIPVNRLSIFVSNDPQLMQDFAYNSRNYLDLSLGMSA